MNLSRSISQLISSVRSVALNTIQKSYVHLDSTLLAYEKNDGPKKFLTFNNKIYPPQTPDEKPRPAVSNSVTIEFDYIISYSLGFSLCAI